MTDVTDLDPELRARVIEGIYGMLPVVLRRESVEADETTALMADLGMSSTSALEVILALEEHLEREISVEDMGREDFATVGTLADYVAGNLLPEE